MLSQNLEYLRKKSKLSQVALAEALQIPRTTYIEYEKGRTEPNLSLLMKLSEFFNVSIDSLIKENVSHKDFEQIRNKDFKVLAMTVDVEGRNNIELVDSKAEAGYLTELANPEYIKELPKMSFPILTDGYYRAFEIYGDSMLPLESGSIVICKYVERLEDVKPNKTYIVITQKNGLIYKRLYHDKDKLGFIAVSDNPFYDPYFLAKDDIQEIWRYQAHIGFSDLKQVSQASNDAKITDIHQKVAMMYERLK